MENQEGFTYYFSKGGRHSVSPRQPQESQKPQDTKLRHRKKIESKQNPSRINPFAALIDENLSGSGDENEKQEVPLRPKATVLNPNAENFNPNRQRFMTKHVISASQNGVQSVRKISTLAMPGQASTPAASTTASTSEPTTQDDELDNILGQSHHVASVMLTQ
jgi:hypothetical protein